MDTIERLEHLMNDYARALAELDVGGLSHDEAVRLHRDVSDLQRLVQDLQLRCERASG
jgi:hypothetical protein